MNYVHTDSKLKIGDILLGVDFDFGEIVIVTDISYSPSIFGGLNDITIKYKNGEERTYKEYKIADWFKKLKLEEIK